MQLSKQDSARNRSKENPHIGDGGLSQDSSYAAGLESNFSELDWGVERTFTEMAPKEKETSRSIQDKFPNICAAAVLQGT